MHTGAPRPPWVLFTFQTTLDDSLSDKEECKRYTHPNTAGHPDCDTHIKQQKGKIRVGIFCSYNLWAYSILVYKRLWVILHLWESKSNPWTFSSGRVSLNTRLPFHPVTPLIFLLSAPLSLGPNLEGKPSSWPVCLCSNQQRNLVN